jgi:hypothetical protein
MPIPNVSRDIHGMFPETPIIGEYRTDNERTPIFNPADSGVMYLAGEPILLTLAGKLYVYMMQGVVRPGETGYAIRKFSADFPCDLSAEVAEGDAIYWDVDEDGDGFPAGAAKLVGDVTNGFLLGYATHHYMKTPLPEVDGDDKVICGDENSTYIYVTSLPGPTVGLGTLELDES